jgi:predicted regulator of Ras-like GTPase activity (Roadblock/LC7/MglB family)
MFKETLQNVVSRTEGCLGALVMGTDGIAVEKFWLPKATEKNLDLAVAVAEYTSLMRNARRTNKELEVGDLKELNLVNEKGIFLMRLLNDDYFVALVLEPNGNIGRGRYELQLAELLLEQEFVL